MYDILLLVTFASLINCVEILLVNNEVVFTEIVILLFFVFFLWVPELEFRSREGLDRTKKKSKYSKGL